MTIEMDNSSYEKMLLEGLKALCIRNESLKKQCGRFLHIESFSECDVQSILSTLCKLLLHSDYTLVIASCFPQILLELLSITLDKSDISNFSKDDETIHKQICIALGKLVRFHPDAVRFSLQYFENNPSPFHKMVDTDPLSSKRRKLAASNKVNVTELDIVISCYNFLQVSCEHFRTSWDWSVFMEMYIGHGDDLVNWIACQCVAWVTGMSDTERQNFVSQYFSSKSARTCVLKFNDLQSDARIKPVSIRSNLDTMWRMASKSVVTVSGIQLPVFNAQAQKKDGLVPVPSTLSNLHSLALAVASGRAICLQGPVGCGKTALVEHLAQITGRVNPPQFLKVQLGDQMDSKMLLGTYRCTDIPGEFVWQPGVLTEAAVGGHWLLLEDIDTAAMDVASVLASLLETGTLTVPGYRDNIQVSPGFQLFVTQRLVASVSGFQRQMSAASSLLEKHWLQVNVEPLSKSELEQVVQTMFPVLSTISSRIVKVFLLFSMGSHDSALISENTKDSNVGLLKSLGVMKNSGRLISTRDLIKWCHRAVRGFDIQLPESALKVFQDAIDIFCSSLTDLQTRLQLATAIGSCLGIVKTKAEYFCLTHKPNISMTPLCFIAGRAVLRKQVEAIATLNISNRSNFTFTRLAACLLEWVSQCISRKEPVLLVGETGTGKTSVVQYLADRTQHRLVVINMNQQSDSADLLGGYKPVDLKYVVAPVREEFEEIFRSFFSVLHNAKFLENISTCFNSRKWTTLLRLMKQSHIAAMRRLDAAPEESERRNVWLQFGRRLHKLETQVNAQSALAFAFIEGSLVKALREGYWVLLDEINLASAETLQCLSGLLEGSTGSLYLLERGDSEPIKRHPQFHLFACMNPATDVGKKDLPAGLRNRFTEFFVDELTDQSDLMMLVGSYLQGLALSETRLEKLVRFYLAIRKEASISLTDGTGHKPHYSLRTLCRALSVAARNPCGSSLRSLYEAMCLSFLTQLDQSSHPAVMAMVSKAVVGSSAASGALKQPIPEPSGPLSGKYVCFEGYWVLQGSLPPVVPEKYILTPSVRRNLHDLVRVVSIGRHPVLLQGETSVGKTSLITYLAQASGNHCVRINNHEHTDLQEYVGSYCADEDGCLVFREGVLVEAMRKGHWIILDELNLAPTDVLEALNRVLDDNRELFIPETQETVKANPHFMLFATQNPPGLYGGRKMLSRAFRNRFVELHFAEIPPGELETILHKRCDMPTSYCKKLVAVMTGLQQYRRESAAFAGKQGFITLRDLFRWGERYRLAQDIPGKLYDWDQHVADEGYLVLAGRVRKQDECQVICQVLQKHIKRTVDPDTLFTLNEKTSPVTRTILEKVVSKPIPGFEHIVWTLNMSRLAVLVGKAFQFQEPVLLVGETGCGKTTVCQVLAALQKQTLYTVNCHMHTESSDFLGGLRPVREHSNTEGPQKLFEWVDGPLISAMESGHLFLADEISLADDSVLERLNSLLEPERKLLLAEKGTTGTGVDENDRSCIVVAQGDFHFIGTMNPGGDYGKKELSPALRNRFTEIWCEACTLRSDFLAIIEHNLRPGLSLGNQEDGTSGVGNCMLDFIEWFTATEVGKRFAMSVRDIMSWVNFINVCTEGDDSSQLDVAWAYIHGACLTFLDSFGSGVTSIDSAATLKALQSSSLHFLMDQMKLKMDESFMKLNVVVSETRFGMHPFYIQRGNFPTTSNDFTFAAPTTGLNALRVLRALQLTKPILLEGSPGVGKTSLVDALAKASGHQLVRINISDQTDVSDLFGADLPVEGGEGGQFAWRDGPFLLALKAGDWILLDELNLASQSVLEGLNACLDHRGEVFIPELGRTFHVQPGRTHLFGAQNPLRQGGARRGLPQSFLNRFTQVYIDALSDADLEFIISALFLSLPSSLVSQMVRFNARLARETGELRLWGHRGSPWELNLRDLCRWCQALTTDTASCETDSDMEEIDVMNDDSDISVSGKEATLNPGKYVGLIYVDRMRTLEDKEKVKAIYCEEFGQDYPLCCDIPRVQIARDMLFVGDVALPRSGSHMASNTSKTAETVLPPCVFPPEQQLLLLRNQFSTLRSLAKCVDMNWLAILVGPSASGKTSAVHLLSQLVGQELRTLSINSAMDTTEILGGFEQADYNRHLEEAACRIERLLLDTVRRRLVSGSGRSDIIGPRDLLRQFEAFRKISKQDGQTLAEETELFCRRLEALQEIVACLPSSGLSSNLLPGLEAVAQKLTTLQTKLKKETGLNAGGKFEWVDSVLVKCLQDGCWLLLDGVNLCSPAVLDRLNALLEPGGVLTIGERGVGPSGDLVTIKPHPNFRLFLTMDPRHGEISRAMRNRGIEICLLEGDKPDGLDMAALLDSAGLASHLQQQALLAVHRAMTDAWQDVEDPNVSHLLHAAFLIRQQTVRGHSPYQAFLSSCSDVYIKAHARSLTGGSSGAAMAKQRLYQALIEALDEYRAQLEDNKERPEDNLPIHDVTIQTSKLQENSSVAMVKQQGALLTTLLDALVMSKPAKEGTGHPEIENRSISADTHILKHLLDVPNKECNLPYLLLIFYQTATVNDIQFRHDWLANHVRKCIQKSTRNHIDLQDCLQFVLSVSLVLKGALASSSKFWSIGSYLEQVCGSRGLPWDLRWLPEIMSSITQHSARDAQEYIGVANNLALYCYFTFLKKVEEMSKHDIKSSGKIVTVMLYSTAVTKGEATDDVTDHPLVTLFVPLVQQLDAQIEAVLSSGKTSLTHEQWVEMVPALAWRFRYAEQGSIPLLRSIDAAVDSLLVHYTWLSKWLLPKLQALVEQDSSLLNNKRTEELLVTVNTINASITGHTSPLLAVSKRMRRCVSQPLPFSTERQGDLAKQAHRLSSLIQVWPDLDPGHVSKQQARVVFLLSLEGRKVRCDLVKALHLLKTGGDELDAVSEVIRLSEEQCTTAGLNIGAPHEVLLHTADDKLGEKQLLDAAQVQLWPIQELFLLALSAAFRRELMQSIVRTENEQIAPQGDLNSARQLVAQLERLPSAPPTFVALLKKFSTTCTSQQCVPELMMWLLKHTALSPARCPSRFWLRWSHAPQDSSVEECMNTIETAEDAFPLHCPLLTRLVTDLTLSDSSAADLIVTSTLGSQRSSKYKLSTLQEMLWRNAALMAQSHLDLVLNDAACANAAFQHLAQALGESLSDESAPCSSVESIVARLHAHVNELEGFPVVEVNHLTEALRKLSTASSCLQRPTNTDVETLLLTGEMWTLIGYVQITMFSKFGAFDPVEKKALKLQYTIEEHRDTARMLYAHELQAHLLGQCLDAYDEMNLHPHILAYRDRVSQLEAKKQHLAKNVAFRPSNMSSFQLLKKEVHYYIGSLGSAEIVLGFYRRLVSASQDLLAYQKQSEDDKRREHSLIQAAEDAIHEERRWRDSQRIFCERLNKAYGTWYPDMVTPLMSAITELCHGTSLLASVLNKLLLQTRLTDATNVMFNLVRFPVLGVGQETILDLVKSCSAPTLCQLMSRALAGDTGDVTCRQETYRLMHCALSELQNQVAVQGVLERTAWDALDGLLSQLVAAWRRQEEERVAREKEQDSLFVTKGTTRCKTLTDEEQAALEIHQLFPTTIDQDFADLQAQTTLEGTPEVASPETEEAAVGLITAQDVDQICQLHAEIVTSFSQTAWLAPSTVGVQPDFLMPLVQRFKTFSLILDKAARGISSSLDMKLSPSLLVLASLAVSLGQGSDPAQDMPMPSSPSRHPPSHNKPSTDFYHDHQVDEVKPCLPLLQNLTKRVNELLEQWPDHPTLNQILKIVERIVAFPIRSPVARFLTGLELLLSKLQEWEENAHSGVSLAAYSSSITHQIVSWRKLELQCWKDCLSSAARRAKCRASRWWFHIYSLVEAFIQPATDKDVAVTSQDLIKTLQKFMEESSLGEFQARLRILYSFHCHTTHLQPCDRRDEIMSILWNVHTYYSQFSDNVDARIRDLRSPIEKKLKDFVKIARWNDISYWAIKQAVEKTHRTLHKHVKEFEDILKQPAVVALNNPKTENANTEVAKGQWDRPQRHQPRQYQYMLEPLHFVANPRLKRFITGEVEASEDIDLLPRAGSLFSKARGLCKETILASSYPRLVQTVESLVTEIIETSTLLKNLEVSKDIPKSKQKSQAKGFLQQKRKALADLFRTLQQMGLSYRTGTALWNSQDSCPVDFVLPPVDFKVAFQYLKSRRPDGQLLSVWDGCETYFMRSVARLALLHTALQNPSKDLGPPSIERCRGFADHLMILAREQKQKLANSSRLLCLLRCQVAQLTAMEETDVVLPRQSELQHSMKCLKELLVTSVICLEQFRLLLHACPSEPHDDLESSFLISPDESLDFPMLKATKNDEVWEQAIKKVKNLILAVTKMKVLVMKSETVIPFGQTVVSGDDVLDVNILVTPSQYELLAEGFGQVEKFADEVKNLKEMFEYQQDSPSENPLSGSLHWLESVMRQEILRFKEKNAGYSDVTGRKEVRTVEIDDEHDEDDGLLVSETIATSKEQKWESPISFASKHLKEEDREKLVAEFRCKTEQLMKTVLIVIQKLYKKYTTPIESSAEGGEIVSKEEAETEKCENSNENIEEDLDKIEDGHIKEKIIENIADDLSVLNMEDINNQLESLVQKLVSILDLQNSMEEGNVCKRLLLRCLPCMDQLTLLCQFFVSQQVAAYRVSCKMLSVLLSVFLDLAQKGFCIPPELAPGEDGGEVDNAEGGMGLGDGEGEKDVSERIESEDQLEDARPQGEERKEDDRDCKEEEKGIETSEDFGGKIQDLEKKEGEGDLEESGEEEEPDKEMGETEEGADKLDQQIWGSDSEGEGDDDGGEEEKKEEEGGSGEKIGEPELGAKDDKHKQGPESEDEAEGDGDAKQNKPKKDINELEEPEIDDDHVDPYHGKHQPEPEPEPLDLPEDLQLDEGDAKEGVEGEENPFDIDAMKEKAPPEVEDEEKIAEEKEELGKELPGDSSDEDEEEGGPNDGSGEKNTEDADVETDGEGEEVDGGSKDEEKEGDKPKEEEQSEESEVAKPSDDQPSDAPNQQAAPMETDTVDGSKDKVAPELETDRSSGQQQPEDMTTEGGDEKEGVGQAQAEDDKTGHRGQLTTPRESLASQNKQPEPDPRQEKRQRPGQSDSSHTLGDVDEPTQKRLKTIETPKKDAQEGDEKEQEEVQEAQKSDEVKSADTYQHITEAKQSFDTQTLDAATKDQAETQPVPNLDEEPAEELSPDDKMEIQDDVPAVEVEEDIPLQNPETVSTDKKQGKEKPAKKAEENMDVEVEGEKVLTLRAARGNETTFHTMYNELTADGMNAEQYDLQAVRTDLEKQLASWTQPPADEEATRAWESFLNITSSLARDLSEQLRLVLEPTQASRLRGDFRTGRRINMRKVIPYIASQFRKDKIWLRRTKPSKREYQIVLAMDDSASMADNHSKELAFESLALVSRALTLLEAGELAVVSFGESPKVLHQLGDSFTEQSGARLLQQFLFSQTSTRLGQLVDFVTTMFSTSNARASSGDNAQLLVIVSDGRGVFSEGSDKVKLAIRRARQARIFMVFVIVENPDHKDSIFDIRIPVFSGSDLVCIKSYLDEFPFPFYLILRDINALPAVLSDSLRQWFELVANMDNK